ncbi:MAG: hypothetical protein AB7F76_00440 [Parvibaculaceae bacterium]
MIEALRRASDGQIDEEGMVTAEDGGIFYATRTPTQTLAIRGREATTWSREE